MNDMSGINSLNLVLSNRSIHELHYQEDFLHRTSIPLGTADRLHIHDVNGVFIKWHVSYRYGLDKRVH